ncbi:YiaA/YiaB family inner membrane protein [Nocardioides pakistanensis]
MTTAPASKTTTAFYIQSVIAFAAALTAVTFGIWFLPVDGWIRAFLVVGSLFLVTSTFTLAKVIRDQQETAAVTARIDQARMEKMLAEHDPFAPAV